jgi:hypothetical protein
MTGFSILHLMPRPGYSEKKAPRNHLIFLSEHKNAAVAVFLLDGILSSWG